MVKKTLYRPSDELVVGPPARVAGRADPDRLQNPASPQLLRRPSDVIGEGELVVVGLDAADVVGGGRVQRLHQQGQRLLELFEFAITNLLKKHRSPN